MRSIFLGVPILSGILLLSPAHAKTLILDGGLSSRIRITQHITFAVTGKKDTFTFRFALPASGAATNSRQSLTTVNAVYQPEPDQVKEETDRFGNTFRLITWKNLDRDARADLSYEVSLQRELRAMESVAPFPPADLPESERVYLQATEQVQSGDHAVAALAAKLTAGSTKEYEAVTAIMRHVADSVAYEFNPPRYDALYTLQAGTGNCQNYAHLAVALLRASGIPARVVGGYTLKDGWKIPVGGGASLVQSIGQGGHAWLEIYFPDLGWLSYDPQQSLQFTSTRHVKQTHGLQVKDIVDTWRAVPPVPQFSETTEAAFLDDRIDLRLTGEVSDPRGYLASNRITVPTAPPLPREELPQVKPEPVQPPDVLSPPEPAEPLPAPVPAPVVPAPPPGPHVEPAPTPAADEQKPPQPVVEPAPPKPLPHRPKPLPPEKRLPPPGSTVTLGNTSFPSLVEFYTTVGDTGSRILEKETAEYVTSRGIYAQAFRLHVPLNIVSVSLAMKKFGGDGTIYVDIVADEKGKPGVVNGIRSLPVFLEKVKRQPGYAWVDFSFPSDASPFPAGKYWIVLRHSGEAILNWFYSPGKRYGDPEDTRSTSRGWQWEDILNFDFVFRVSGKVPR